MVAVMTVLSCVGGGYQIHHPKRIFQIFQIQYHTKSIQKLSDIFTPEKECQEAIRQFASKLPLNISTGRRPSHDKLGRAKCINHINTPLYYVSSHSGYRDVGLT